MFNQYLCIWILLESAQVHDIGVFWSPFHVKISCYHPVCWNAMGALGELLPVGTDVERSLNSESVQRGGGKPRSNSMEGNLEWDCLVKCMSLFWREVKIRPLEGSAERKTSGWPVVCG